MLRELTVRNLALIEDVRVELEPGFCVWTGETGAGKSLLLTALGLVLGGKATPDLIRSGKTEARAAAVFDSSDVDLGAEVAQIIGAEPGEDGIILTRRVTSQGRSQAYVNDLPVSAATLRQLAPRLLDIHGQSEGRALFEPDRQRSLLDAFGGLEKQVESYRQRRRAYDDLRKRRDALRDSASRSERERALLSFELDELKAFGPRPGEVDELSVEARRLANADAIRTAATEGVRLLHDGDGSAQELIARVARRLSGLSLSATEMAETSAVLNRLGEELREAAFGLRRLAKDTEDDPDRLDAIEERLALYRKLSTRLRCPANELAARRDDIARQLAAIDRGESDLAAIEQSMASAWTELRAVATALSTARRKSIKTFSAAVQAQLKDLHLKEARINVAINTSPLGEDAGETPAEAGVDAVEIVFAPNPGEEPRPLRKIASGGELSRVTLAVKTVLAQVDRVATIVFDEVDVGVGGRLGAVLGRKLAALSQHRQVLSVTHLPQLASFATSHWAIRKTTERGRTRTTITKLADAQRVEELAAMLRGDSAAEGTRKEAQAMLAEAQSRR